MKNEISELMKTQGRTKQNQTVTVKDVIKSSTTLGKVSQQSRECWHDVSPLIVYQAETDRDPSPPGLKRITLEPSECGCVTVHVEESPKPLWLEDESPEQRKPWGGHGRPQPRPEMVFRDEREIRGQRGGDGIFGSFEESGAVSLEGNSGMLACFLCLLPLVTDTVPDTRTRRDPGNRPGVAGWPQVAWLCWGDKLPDRDGSSAQRCWPAPGCGSCLHRGRSQDHTSGPPLCFWQSHQT